MNNNEYFFSFFPQFCSDPINDKAWGEGFTDWNLVSQLKPEEAACFTPKIGFYNTTDSFYLEYLVEELNILRSLRAGLMIYHYYFDGVHALDQFEKNFLAADTGCPFFLCWANESWTKRWIGKPKDVIIRQDHLPDKDTIRSHVKYLIQFFDKPNYRRHNGRPILIIYNPQASPNLLASLSIYRNCFQEFGHNPFIGCCLSYPQSSKSLEVYDFVCEFEPRFFFNSQKISFITKLASRLKSRFPDFFEILGGVLDPLKKISGGSHHRYSDYLTGLEKGTLLKKIRNSTGDLALMRSTFLSWDNKPRYRDRNSHVSHDPDNLVRLPVLKLIKSDNGLPVIINSWNEWSEGAALEPAAYPHTLRSQFLNALGDDRI